jgi:hypothetical protein
MDRTRTILYEAARIFLTGVVFAIVIMSARSYLAGPSIVQFQKEYGGKPLAQQVSVAEKYLDSFTTSELNAAIEEQNKEGFCHSQAHALGRAVYKRTNNFTESIRQCGNSCTFGCFHGVLMQMFSTDSDTLGGAILEDSPDAYLAQVKTEAEGLCARPEVASEVHARYCYHGLGHVFGFIAGTSLDGGLASCNIYKNEHAALYCRSGVFMEYLFGPSQAHILYTKGPEPCDAYPAFTAKCYRYKAYGWIEVWGGVRPALKACDSFGTNMLLCIANTAEAAATEGLLGTREGMESICGGLTGEKRDACVDGALTKIIDLNDGDDSEHVCDLVAAEYRPRCLAVRTGYESDVYFSH